MSNRSDYGDERLAWKPSLADLLGARAMLKRRGTQGGRFGRWEHEVGPPPEDNIWLLTYLDIVNLLLVMMVVMVSFNGPATRKPGTKTTAPPVAVASSPAPAALPLNARTSIVAPLSPPNRLKQLPLKQLGDQVEVIEGNNSMRFRIRNELLFASGEAGLTAEGLHILDTLLPIFNLANEHNIAVEGHADNTPINTLRFPSNWELAAGRAASVVRHLQDRGISATRLRATGYADTRPIAPNDTLEGQRANRRVELILELPRKED